MNAAKQLVHVAALAGWGCIALYGVAFSQTTGATRSTAARSDFEQRAVSRSSSVSSQSTGNPYRTVWAPTYSTAYQAPTTTPKTVGPAPAPTETIQGAMEMEPIPADAYPMMHQRVSSGGCESCGEGGDCESGACCPRGGDCWAGCEDGCVAPLFPLCLPLLRNFSIFAGVHGFKNAADEGLNGNFGFHEGFNWGGPLGQVLLGDGVREIGWQVGLNATQSNLSPSPTDVPGTDRNQLFATGGLFKRAACGGLQWGVVFDFLHDQYYEKTDMRQLRAELSLAKPCWGEIGFWGAFGAANSYSEEHTTGNQLDVKPLDMYVLFLRRYFTAGGEGRIWGGWTDNRDGLIGADMEIPLGPSFALVNAFNYMIPQEGRTTGREQESWSVTMSLAWYPGRMAMCARQNPFRPLMPVADNTYFMRQQDLHD